MDPSFNAYQVVKTEEDIDFRCNLSSRQSEGSCVMIGKVDSHGQSSGRKYKERFGSGKPTKTSQQMASKMKPSKPAPSKIKNEYISNRHGGKVTTHTESVPTINTAR